VDPATNAGAAAADTAQAGAQAVTTFDAQTLLDLLHQGGLTVYPLALCSVIVVAIVVQQLWRYRGLDGRTRELTRKVVDALVRRDVTTARSLCETSKTPIGEIFLEGLRWRNIALEDLNSVLATSRQEASARLRTGLWVIGTIGSLAPFIGLFGTVVGIIKAFHEMAVQGSGGFAVVAAGISEALVATAAGLLVAIFALAAYNYLQVRSGAVASNFARACERFVQALLYVESVSLGQPPAAPAAPAGKEVRHGHPLPA
jgi:biopolymer transport protein ExbB